MNYIIKNISEYETVWKLMFEWNKNCDIIILDDNFYFDFKMNILCPYKVLNRTIKFDILKIEGSHGFLNPVFNEAVLENLNCNGDLNNKNLILFRTNIIESDVGYLNIRNDCLSNYYPGYKKEIIVVEMNHDYEFNMDFLGPHKLAIINLKQNIFLDTDFKQFETGKIPKPLVLDTSIDNFMQKKAYYVKWENLFLNEIVTLLVPFLKNWPVEDKIILYYPWNRLLETNKILLKVEQILRNFGFKVTVFEDSSMQFKKTYGLLPQVTKENSKSTILLFQFITGTDFSLKISSDTMKFGNYIFSVVFNLPF